MGDILSRLRAKKSSGEQSKPPYPLGKYDGSHDVSLDAMRYSNVSVGDPPNVLAGLTDIMGNQDMWAHINKAANAQAQQAHLGQYPPGYPTPSIVPPNPPASGQTLSSRAREMFLKRMGGLRAELKIAPDDFLHCHIYGEMVFLFYCFSGRDGCVKENIDLFPSDQLITQFRMVLST